MNEDAIALYEVTSLNKAIRDLIDPPHHINSRQLLVDGKVFAVITIPSAIDVLLLAKKQNDKARFFCGRLYVRNSAAETAEVKDNYEFRKALERIRFHGRGQ